MQQSLATELVVEYNSSKYEPRYEDDCKNRIYMLYSCSSWAEIVSTDTGYVEAIQVLAAIARHVRDLSQHGDVSDIHCLASFVPY